MGKEKESGDAMFAMELRERDRNGEPPIQSFALLLVYFSFFLLSFCLASYFLRATTKPTKCHYSSFFFSPFYSFFSFTNLFVIFLRTFIIILKY